MGVPITTWTEVYLFVCILSLRSMHTGKRALVLSTRHSPLTTSLPRAQQRLVAAHSTGHAGDSRAMRRCHMLLWRPVMHGQSVESSVA